MGESFDGQADRCSKMVELVVVVDLDTEQVTVVASPASGPVEPPSAGTLISNLGKGTRLGSGMISEVEVDYRFVGCFDD